MKIIRAWWQKYFSENEAIILVLLLFTLFMAIILMGDVLGPVLASVVISYLLYTLVNGLVKLRANANLALYGVYTSFLALFLAHQSVVLNHIADVSGLVVDRKLRLWPHRHASRRFLRGNLAAPGLILL